jgi:UDP:flavonoid glycosyltransferase YjiC (YdhE family)
MAKIALCSERMLGDETLRDLAACAHELSSQNHTVYLICDDLEAADKLAEFDDLKKFQAPILNSQYGPRGRRKSRPINFSQLLVTQGYNSQSALVPVLRAWIDLFNVLGVDHVICDQAPSALIASNLRSISSVMIGDGFRVPPKSEGLPSFRPWRTAPDKKRKDLIQMKNDDKMLLESVTAAVCELGFKGANLTSPSSLYAHAQQWLMSVPEMDHFGRRELPYVVRWPSTKSLSDPVWPEGQGDKVFVVLKSHSSHSKTIFSQLRSLDLPVLAIVADASPSFISEFVSDKVKIQTDMVNLRSVAQQCKIVFSDAEHDLIYELLTYGVPSVLLPKGIQNTLLTFRLAKKRLGFAGPSKSSKLDVAALIEKTQTFDQVWHNASRFSLKYATHRSLTRLCDLVSELCTKPSDLPSN